MSTLPDSAGVPRIFNKYYYYYILVIAQGKETQEFIKKEQKKTETRSHMDLHNAVILNGSFS